MSIGCRDISYCQISALLLKPNTTLKTEKQQAAAAAEFAERWKGRGYERGESQPFWIDLLNNVFGIETPTDGFIRFEEHQMVDSSNFVDGRIPSTRVLIEQKSLGIHFSLKC